MVTAIAIAEVAFWVLIVLGLAARYLAGRRRLGLALLSAVPVVDALLLLAVVVDLIGGATAEQAHALAAIYLGVSVAFGPSMIEWADVRFAHRFAGGPPPAPKPTSSEARTARERRGWLRHARAWAIGAGLMLLITVVVGDADRTQAFTSTAALWTVVLAIDGVFSLPRRPAKPARPLV